MGLVFVWTTTTLSAERHDRDCDDTLVRKRFNREVDESSSRTESGSMGRVRITSDPSEQQTFVARILEAR